MLSANFSIEFIESYHSQNEWTIFDFALLFYKWNYWNRVYDSKCWMSLSTFSKQNMNSIVSKHF